ncbi:hypothetical protein YK48G_26260 [Lentilactobacillus fungorum]|uniref:Uncharacterized protein n=1 Tax=Lentilactobacillus fungorum TaxID=2201250 RepID=A0ABQ3W3L5_9LACO|nr:hypothetical protein YK48G_26260 [Lentilactobacillus fungorum]
MLTIIAVGLNSRVLMCLVMVGTLLKMVNRLRSKKLNDKRLDEQHINVPFVKPFSLANYLAGQLKMS